MDTLTDKLQTHLYNDLKKSFPITDTRIHIRHKTGVTHPSIGGLISCPRMPVSHVFLSHAGMMQRKGLLLLPPTVVICPLPIS